MERRACASRARPRCILAFAAEDHLRTLADAFRGSCIPNYAGDTLARAALESAGRCGWLMEVPVSVEERLARGTAIELKSRIARLLYDGEIDPHRATPLAELDELKAARNSLKLPHQGCPGYMASMELAIGEGKTGRFGDTVGRMLAGTAHSELYALTRAFVTADAVSDPVTGTLGAPIANELAGCYRSMALAAIGYRHLLVAHVQLFRWPSPALAETVRDALDTLADQIPGVPRQRGEDRASGLE
jgi:hypothetical protein